MAPLILQSHEQLAELLLPRCQPWRKMIIGVDGVNGGGKSRVARYLAWKLEMPVVETDLFMLIGTGRYELRSDDLGRVLRTRFDLNRPVIVEGAFLLQTLRDLGLRHDLLVYARRVPPTSGERLHGLDQYLASMRPEIIADYVYEWREAYAS